MTTASLCMTSSWRNCKYFFQTWKFWNLNSIQLQSFCLHTAVQQQLLINLRVTVSEIAEELHISTVGSK